MLITKVMHYLLINGSSLFRAGDGSSKRMISVGTKKGDSSENGERGKKERKRRKERRGGNTRGEDPLLGSKQFC